MNKKKEVFLFQMPQDELKKRDEVRKRKTFMFLLQSVEVRHNFLEPGSLQDPFQ